MRFIGGVDRETHAQGRILDIDGEAGLVKKSHTFKFDLSEWPPTIFYKNPVFTSLKSKALIPSSQRSWPVQPLSWHGDSVFISSQISCSENRQIWFSVQLHTFYCIRFLPWRFSWFLRAENSLHVFGWNSSYPLLVQKSKTAFVLLVLGSSGDATKQIWSTEHCWSRMKNKQFSS